MKSGKIWGTTTTLLQTPFVELHKLSILPRSMCSMHKHRHKWNAFYVISGKLIVEARKLNYNLTDVTEIGPGEIATFPPGEFHRFHTRDQAVECLEFYYPEPLSEDIIRETATGEVKCQLLINTPPGS